MDAPRRRTAPLLLTGLLVAACGRDKADTADSAPETQAPPTCAEVGSPYALDDTLRLTDAQALGTHNSTHLEPDTPLDDSHRYSHPPLAEQLALGVRMVELDIHLRDDGNFEVFHLPVIDDKTTCQLLSDCLTELKDWSDANPCHLPLLVWIEPKDDADVLDETLLPLLGRYADLEAALAEVWPAERVITPDEVRGTHATLTEAIQQDGWPTLGGLRGRVLFAMIGEGEHRAAYLAESPELAGRWLFVDMADLSSPVAAIAKDGSPEDLRALAEAGLLVATNVDGVTRSDEENAASLATYLEAGIHFVASDLVVPQDGHTYVAEIPGGQPARCNPITAPTDCTAADIESPPAGE